jgi:hypothetical protein
MPVSRQTFINLTTNFLADTFAEFKQSFDIIENVRTPDGQGGFTIVRNTFASTEGFIFPEKGSEPVQEGGKYTDQNFKFSFKPIAGFTNQMIIRYASTDYKITSIVDLVESDIWLNVLTEVDE